MELAGIGAGAEGSGGHLGSRQQAPVNDKRPGLVGLVRLGLAELVAMTVCSVTNGDELTAGRQLRFAH
jgi:hypothetical protein